MSQLKVNSIVDAAGGSAAVLYGVASPPNSMGFRNRLINSDMRIDQRNAGASVTVLGSGYFTVDRFSLVSTQSSKMSVQQSTTAPTGFKNSIAITSLSAYSVGATDAFNIDQRIEGFNVADLAWGTASAQAVTVSFWVRSSLTGTFGGAILNGAGDRSYPFSYTVSAANTFEYKTITIPGDTSGTWLTTNGIGMRLSIGLGVGSTYSGTVNTWGSALYLAPTGATSVVGTNGATFYVTGVQLEAGSVASPFERRDYGRELMMCQRYYWKGTVSGQNFHAPGNGSIMSWPISFPVTMRSVPTASSSLVGIVYSTCSGASWGIPTADNGRFILSATGATNNAYFTLGASDFIAASSEL